MSYNNNILQTIHPKKIREMNNCIFLFYLHLNPNNYDWLTIYNIQKT